MKRAWTAAFFIVLLIFVISCRINVPIEEMVKARVTITEAYTVKADKYAPELLQEAEKHLYSSHDFCVKDDISDAKKEANQSFQKATEAINKALPLLADDTLKQAKDVYGEAEKLYAEKFSPDEFAKAGSLIEQSSGQFDKKEYRESWKSSGDAQAEAEAAKQKSLQEIPNLKENTENLTRTRNELLAAPGKDAVMDELTKAGSSLDKATAALTSQELKVVYEENTAAAQYLDLAKNKIAKTSTKDKITALRQEIQTLKSERGIDFAGEDLETAESSLNEADSLLEQDRAPDSIAKMNDAEDALDRAKSKTSKGIATEKIQNVETLLATTKNKDAGKKNPQEIEKASLLIGEGKQLLLEDSYEASITKADEAESVLNALGVSDEIDISKKTSEKDTEGGLQNVYTVQYNKKHPDCLWRIAHKVYKNARLWPLIYVANKNIIRDPDLIFPGQHFQIPPIPKQKQMTPGDSKQDIIQTVEDATDESVDMKKEPDKQEEMNTIEK